MRKKIFFIIPNLAGGGAERVFSILVNKIDKTVFDVVLVFLTDEQNVYEISSDVRTINLNVKRVRNASFKIIKLIRKEKPSLVISTQGHLNQMLLILKAFFPKKTKLVIRQTNIMSLNKSENKTKRLIEKGLNKLYKKADKIVCQSEFMKNDFIKITKIKKNVVKIYNPVDIESVIVRGKETIDYKFNNTRKNIFFAGRLDKVKRISLIIDAFKTYQKQNNQSRLYILGEGPEKNYLAEYIYENKLSNSVILLGFQKNPHKWLRHADLFIMASKHEGMPNMLLEVLALEIPVLILRHPGGTEEIMKLLDIEDRFIENLIIKTEFLNSYNKNIRSELQKKFGVENVIRKYEELFIEILEKD